MRPQLGQELQRQLLIDESPVGVMLCRPSGEILEVNAALREFLGYGTEDLVGRPISDFWPPEDAIVNLRVRQSVVTGDVRAFEHERRYVRGDGSIVHGLLHLRSIRDVDGNEVLLAHIVDVSARHRVEEALRRSGATDRLTGLSSRQALADTITQVLGRGAPRTLIVAEVNGFRNLTERAGMSVADRMLADIASELNAVFHNAHCLARLGDSEFALLVSPDESERASVKVCQLASDLFAQQPLYRGLSINVGVRHLEASTPVATIVSEALHAARLAREQGPYQTVVFSAELGARASRESKILESLPLAIVRSELHAHMQAFFDARTRARRGFETLVRWTSPELGAVSPVEFISLAERHGGIQAIGAFVLRRTLELLKKHPELSASVNLSPVQARDEPHIVELCDIISGSGLDPTRLKFEITESVFVEVGNSIMRNVARIKALGTQLWLDDFGTGYASLSLLSSLPFDGLKIDRSFVKGLPSDPRACSLVRAAIGLARELSLGTVAEGVETQEQANALCELGCDLLQGYLLARPVPEHQFGVA